MEICYIHFIFGCLGGIIVQFLGIWKLRTKNTKEWPIYYKTCSFWTIVLVMSLIGGGFAILQLDNLNIANKLLALQIGATAPLLIERITGAHPPKIETSYGADDN